jgi:hypothetical protein
MVIGWSLVLRGLPFVKVLIIIKDDFKLVGNVRLLIILLLGSSLLTLVILLSQRVSLMRSWLIKKRVLNIEGLKGA